DFLNLTDRCASLEADLTANGPSRLRNEFFAEAVELAATAAITPSSSGRAPPAVGPDPNLDEEMQTLAVLMRVLQIMEDVWLAADLDHYWSHPLNQGWMNYFQRWGSTPSFRRWWPILGPIYSPGFREFAKARFAVGVIDEEARADGGRSLSGAGLELRKTRHGGSASCACNLARRRPDSRQPERSPGLLAWRPATSGFAKLSSIRAAASSTSNRRIQRPERSPSVSISNSRNSDESKARRGTKMLIATSKI